MRGRHRNWLVHLDHTRAAVQGQVLEGKWLILLLQPMSDILVAGTLLFVNGTILQSPPAVSACLSSCR